MRYFLLFCLLTASVFGQTLNTSLSTATVRPGAVTTLSLNFVDSSPTSNIAGFQWTFNVPSSAISGTPVIGAAGTSASKVLTCNLLTCLIVGSGSTLNTTSFANGVVANLPITAGVNATNATIPVQLSLSTITAVTGTLPSAVVVTSTPVTLNILSKFDVNGDGVVNATDVNLAIAQADGNTPCTTGDINGDGVCNVIDVEQIIFAIIQ